MNYQEDKQDFRADAAERLNLEAKTASWGSPSIERDPRSVGSAAIVPSEQIGSIEQTRRAGRTPELGQVVNLEMPPGVTPEDVSVEAPDSTVTGAPAESSLASSGQSSITSLRDQVKSTGKITSQEVKTVESRILKLNQDGNIADFYEEIRGAA